MKNRKMKLLSICLFVAFASIFGINKASAQCDTIATLCEANMPKGFISDGQSYRVLLLNDQTGEFHITLYGGSTYRVAACSGMSSGNLIFSLYDQNHQLLFSNKDHSMSPYWNFDVKNTINCILDVKLNPANLASGCGVVLIGFKQ